MRRLAHWLVSLYPKAWKQRYGEEFHALLDDCSPDRLKVAGIVKGALVMRIADLFQSPMRSAALCALSGLAAAACVVFALPPRYRSAAVITAPSPDNVTNAALEVFEPSRIKNLVERHGLFPGGGADREGRFLLSLDVRPVDGGPAAEISFLHADPAKAQAVTRELQAAMIDAGQGLQLASMASLPLRAERRAFGLPMIAGLSAGAMLGFAASRIRRRVRA